MDLDEEKQTILRHPVVRFASVLGAGFMAGVALMQGLQSYSGMTLMTKAKEERLDDQIKKLTDQVQSLSQKNTDLAEKHTQITGALSQSNGSLATCRADHEALSRQAADLSAQLEAANKGKGECDAAKQEGTVSFARALSNAKRLEAELIAIKAANIAMTRLGDSPPKVVSAARTVWTNELQSYFDGALTVAVQSVNSDSPAASACVITNFDTQCRHARVGEVLPVAVGGKKYGIRIDMVRPWGNDQGQTSFTILMFEKE
jgi:prefoldin subunit 5